jgi:hypothetical protein
LPVTGESGAGDPASTDSGWTAPAAASGFASASRTGAVAGEACTTLGIAPAWAEPGVTDGALVTRETWARSGAAIGFCVTGADLGGG